MSHNSVYLLLCVCVCTQSCLTLCDPKDYIARQAPLSMDFPGRITGVDTISSSRGSSWSKDRTCVSCIAGSFLTAELSGKPWSARCSVISDSLRCYGLYSPWNSPGHNTGVGSFSLPQGIFPTQESDPVLPHSKGSPYQLSYQGSPRAYWKKVERQVNRGGSYTPELQEERLSTFLWLCGIPNEMCVVWKLYVSYFLLG